MKNSPAHSLHYPDMTDRYLSRAPTNFLPSPAQAQGFDFTHSGVPVPSRQTFLKNLSYISSALSPGGFEFRMLSVYYNWDNEASNKHETDVFDTWRSALDAARSCDQKEAVHAICKAYALLNNPHPLAVHEKLAVTCEVVQVIRSKEKGAGGEEYVVYVGLEILLFCGCLEELVEHIDLFVHYVVDDYVEDIKSKALKILFALDFPGIDSICNICEEDEELRYEIISILVKEPMVIETILVPALINHFHSNDHLEISKAIAALGRLGNLASRSEAIPLLLDLLKTSNLNKNLVVGSLRAIGMKGTNALCSELKSLKNPKIQSIICYYLGRRDEEYIQNTVEIKIMDHEHIHLDIKRGSICQYEGAIAPPVGPSQSENDSPDRSLNLNQKDEQQKNTIFVNSDDFLIVLKRLRNLREIEFMKTGEIVGHTGISQTLDKSKDFRVYVEVLQEPLLESEFTNKEGLSRRITKSLLRKLTSSITSDCR